MACEPWAGGYGRGMSFQEVLAALPKLAPEERDLLRLRLRELEDEQLVEERRAEYLNDPSSALSLEQIVRAVRQLPRESAAELLDRLLIEAAGAHDTETDVAWRQEVRRRIAEIKSGAEPGVDGGEVMAELRKIVGR